jgi:hypothetical protein
MSTRSSTSWQLQLLGVDVEQGLELALAEVQPLERVERLLVVRIGVDDLPVELERAIAAAQLLLERARHHASAAARRSSSRTSAATRRRR